MGLIVGFATQSVALGFAVGGIFLLYNLLYYRITSVTVVENQLSFESRSLVLPAKFSSHAIGSFKVKLHYTYLGKGIAKHKCLNFYKNNKLCCKLVDNHEGWTDQSILTLNEELTKREVARC
jgi:hypothetical protein